MSAINILSVLTPAAPDGAGPDASIEAATDSAMFADLMLKEETPEAPAAAPPSVRTPAAQTEPDDMGAAVAMIPVWFAPTPEPQQLATGAPALTIEGDDAPLNTDAAAEEPASEKTADTEAKTQDAEAIAAAAPAASSAFAAPANPVAPSANGLALSPAAAPLVALKAAAPVAAASDAPIEAPPAEGETQAEGSTPDRSPLPSPSGPTPAMPGVTGFRSGAGERLASAREVVQAAAQTEGGSDLSAADRLKTSDAPATVAAGAVARPTTAATLPTPPTPAPAPPAADADAPVQPPAAAQTAAPQESAAPRDLGLSHLSRATVETTAQIAAQIIKKLDGRSTRFDMALTPEGLGRVDVSLEIESDGQVTARLAFDTPAAAADLRARADELRRQLMEAGLHLSSDDLEFAERDPSSGFGGGAFERQPDRRAFTGAARLAAEADSLVPPPSAWTSLSLTPDRVDLKV
ncbi:MULTISPECIES: flagellar hook-length control protein FliK [Brevundimonas]|uniref:flagellar hook-length control protein FliK n=1 Tax=Brevundimonas TaxID=41275 RepID=UPI001F3C1AFA|nr:flagellar hook-length control protein FliK [Brevundimonas sp. LPMIX5]